jgi:DNA-binding MarR family transcriptional regulator
MHTGHVTKKLKVTDCLCHNLRKTSRLLTQYYDEMLRPSGIRITQFTLMAAVQQMKESAFVPLSEYLGMDRTTLARNVELLQREGLVETAAGATDRRQQIVWLTAKGESVLQAAMPLWETAQRRALKQLNSGQASELLGELGKLNRVQST